MTPRRQHMMAALPLRGTGERPQEAAVRAVRLLAQCSRTAPDVLAEQALQPSFLHRKNVDGRAPASLRLCSRGIRCFSQHVRTRDWHPRTCLRAPTTHHLPTVLSMEAVRRLRTSATPFHHQVSCPPVSRVGRRLQEALALQGSAIAGQRLQGHVHRGTGAPDRDVPRPAETRPRLRPSWHTPRHTTWLLPATGRDHTPSPPAPAPLRRTRVQGAVRTAPHRAGITTPGVALPPLRPASATPRRAAGLHPRLLQRSLGPPPRAPTLRSCHLTHPGPAEASARRQALLHGLRPGPPAARSSTPGRPSIVRVLPPAPPRTARPSGPSNRAPAAMTATASLRARAVGKTTAASVPVATGPGPRARIIQRNRGPSTTWTNRSRGRTASSPARSLRPCAP